MKQNIKGSICLACMLSATLWADAIDLDSITVSTSPVNNHITFDVPAAVDVLSDEEIISKTTASLGEILSDIPGVDNVSTGSQAGKPVIRGMGGERVKILSNGSATDFQTYGIRHISNMDPFLSDSIEVIRGAQGVLYGSDALGGVVNVLSPKILSAKEGETKLKGEILGEYHSNNNERAGGVKLQSAVGKIGVNVSAIKRKGDNINTPNADTWSVGDPAGTLPRFSGELPYTNYESTSAQVAIGYTDDWGNIGLQHTYWQSYQNYLGHTSGPMYNAISSAGQDLSNNETQLKAEFYAGDWIIMPSISRTINKRIASNGVPYESMNSSNETLDIEVERLDGKLALAHPKIGIFEGEIGIEAYNKDQDVYKGHLVPNAKENGKAIYIFEEADIGKWIGQWGLRYDTRDVDAQVPVDGSKKFSAFGGSLGLTYKLTPNWNIATNLSRGFRAPSIFELYADGIHGGVQAYQIGNVNLKEETTIGGDISLRYKDEKTQAYLTLYHTHIDDYIYLANTGNRRNPVTGAVIPAGGIPELINKQTTAQIQGVEFFIETYLSDDTRFKGTFEIIDGKDKDNNTDLTMMAGNNFSLALYQDIGTFKSIKNNILSVNMKAYDKQEVSGNQEPFSQYNDKTKFPFGSANTAGYVLWGLGYSSKVDMMGQDAELTINVDNLFDTKYRNFLDTYKGYALGMGRNISLSMRIPFSL